MKNSIVRHVLVLFFVLALSGCQQQGGPANKAVVNKPAPDFTIQDLKGNTWKLSDLRGKVVFLNFWATWCPPCREEMPSMKALYEDMDKSKFEMLTILINDQPANGEAFARQLGLDFPILVDQEGRIGALYGLTGVPETFLIDAQGILRQKYIGPQQWDSSGAKELIRSYMN